MAEAAGNTKPGLTIPVSDNYIPMISEDVDNIDKNIASIAMSLTGFGNYNFEAKQRHKERMKAQEEIKDSLGGIEKDTNKQTGSTRMIKIREKVAMGWDKLMKSKWFQSIGKGIAKIAAKTGSFVMDLIKMLAVMAIFDPSGSLFSSILNIVVDIGVKLIEMIANFLPKMVVIIAKLLPKLLNTLGSAIQKIIPALIQGITAAIEALAKLLPMVLVFLVKGVVMIVQGIMQLLPAIVNALVQAIPVLVTGLYKAFAFIIEQIGTLLPKIVDTLLNGISSLITVLLTVIPDLLVGVIKALPILIDGILKSLVMVVQTVIQLIPQIIIMIAQALPKLLIAVIQGVVGILKNIGTILPTLINALITALPIIIQALIQSMGLIVGELIKTLPMLLFQVAKSLINIIITVWKSVGKLLLNTFLDIFLDYIPRLWKGIKNLGVSIWNGIKDIFSGSFFKKKGKSILSNAIDMILKFLRDRLIAFPQMLINIFSTISKKIKQKFGKNNPIVKIFDSIISTLQSIVSWIKIYFSWDGLKFIFSDLKDSIGNAFQSLGDWIVSFFRTLFSGDIKKLTSTEGVADFMKQVSKSAMQSGIERRFAADKYLSERYSLTQGGLARAIRSITSGQTKQKYNQLIGNVAGNTGKGSEEAQLLDLYYAAKKEMETQKFIARRQAELSKEDIANRNALIQAQKKNADAVNKNTMAQQRQDELTKKMDNAFAKAFGVDSEKRMKDAMSAAMEKASQVTKTIAAKTPAPAFLNR